MSSIRPQIDLSGVVLRYMVMSELVLERRINSGYRNDGRWYDVDGAAATASVSANVQPMGAKETQALPEGVRTRDGVVVYSTSEIIPQQRDGDNLGDTFVWKNARYECIQVEDWDTNGRYWRALAIKSDQ